MERYEYYHKKGNEKVTDERVLSFIHKNLLYER